MEQIQEEEKRIIWSNLNLDIEDWREFLEEEYPDRTEDEYYDLMRELNDGLSLIHISEPTRRRR